MPIDIIARGLAASLVDENGKIASEKMPVLGAVPEGTAFYPVGQLQDASLIAGKTAEEILLMILYGVVNPTLVDPSFSVLLNAENDQLIIGRPSTLKGTLTFNRGKIDPAYGTSGYRAGIATNYSVNGKSFETSANQYDFEIEITPINTTEILECVVNFSAGEQPVNSVGQPFGAPLAAGSLVKTLELNAAYALYTNEGQEQEFTWFEDEVGQGYLSTFASEG